MKKLLSIILLLWNLSPCFAADPGFTDISSTRIEAMTYIFPEVVVSTGTKTLVLITDPLWALNAGTTYYYAGPSSVVSSDPSKTSMSITQGKYVHAVHYVNYWVSTSSEIGK